MATTTTPTMYQIMISYGSGGGTIFGGTGGEADGGAINFTDAYGMTDDIVGALYGALSGVTLPEGYTIACSRTSSSTDIATAAVGPDGTVTFTE